MSISSSRNGFTLVEILLAMALVGVLTGVAIVTINPARQFLRVQQFGRAYRANQIENAILQYMVDNNNYPGDRNIPDGEGQAKHICRYGQMESQCVNVDELIPKYLTCMPYDDAETDEDYSGFSIYLTSGRVRVSALYNDQDMTAGGGCEPFPTPLAYWKLDEDNTEGGAADSAGRNDAVYAGSPPPYPTNDVANVEFAFANPRGLRFASADSRLEASDIAFPQTTAVTISAWFKWETDDGNVDPYIVSRGASVTDIRWALGIDDAANTLLFTVNTTSGGPIIHAVGSVQINTWTHVAATYNGAQVCLYKDGASAGCTGKTGSITGTGPAAIRISSSPGSGSEHPFKGILDDVRIYAEPLSQGQIEVIATGGV